jgi:hypothetical protein
LQGSLLDPVDTTVLVAPIRSRNMAPGVLFQGIAALGTHAFSPRGR